jgi:plasmid stabilization system protein ParE
MSKFTLAPLAKSDIAEIWSYYATQTGDLDLADRMSNEIFNGIKVIARRPNLGHLRRDLAAESLRF